MNWPRAPPVVYLDTSAWIRPFEAEEGGLAELESRAVIRILEKHISKKHLVVIGSVFQYRQLVGLQSNAETLEDMKKYGRSANLCKTCCPNPFKPPRHYKSKANELMEKTGMSYEKGPNEDVVHIVMAWMSGAGYFVTTDRGLFRRKKATEIEDALRVMTRPQGRSCRDMRVLNPVDFEKMPRFGTGGA